MINEQTNSRLMTDAYKISKHGDIFGHPFHDGIHSLPVSKLYGLSYKRV
jgi:hypothetical protein